jgi:hypothetical protein
MQLARSLFDYFGGKAMTRTQLEAARQVALDNGHEECADIVEDALDANEFLEGIGKTAKAT